MRNETELFVNEDTEIFCFVLSGDVLAEHGDVSYQPLPTFRDEECGAFIWIDCDELASVLLQRISDRL